MLIPCTNHIVNGQGAPLEVNVQDVLAIGKNKTAEFVSKRPDGFHASLSKEVKIMQKLKKTGVIQGKPIYDTETLLARLLIIGQQ